MARLENVVLRLFVNKGRATELIRNARVVSVIRAVVYQLVSNLSRSAAFYTVVEQAVQNCEAEPHIVRVAMTGEIDTLAFTITMDKFTRHSVEKASPKDVTF